MAVKISPLLLGVLVLVGCEKKHQVPRRLANLLTAHDCKPETDFFETDMMRPPLYATGFLAKLAPEKSIAATVVRCVRDDGLYFLFDIQPEDRAVFGCESLVKYPLPKSQGGLVVSLDEVQGSWFKPVDKGPPLGEEKFTTNLFSLSEYALGDVTGLALACIHGHWYKTEND